MLDLPSGYGLLWSWLTRRAFGEGLYSGFSCHLESRLPFDWFPGTLATGLGFTQLPRVVTKG